LWETSQDRGRAVELARQARDELAAEGPIERKRHDAAVAWLAAHRR